MGHLDPIAYTYEADYHCIACSLKRFGEDELGFVPADATDNEGNCVGALFPWDEWYDYYSDSCEVLVCGDCGYEIDNRHTNSCFDKETECTLRS